jgi:hypothetical protein
MSIGTFNTRFGRGSGSVSSGTSLTGSTAFCSPPSFAGAAVSLVDAPPAEDRSLVAFRTADQPMTMAAAMISSTSAGRERIRDAP